MPNLLTLRQAAAALQINYHTAREWCLAGRIKASQLGRAWRIDAREIDRIMQRNAHYPLDVEVSPPTLSPTPAAEVSTGFVIPLPPSLRRRGAK